jgi:hypothetical protein
VIAEAIRELRRKFDLPVDPTQRGPVLLDRFFQEMNRPRVSHFTLSGLTRGSVAEHLRSQSVSVDDIGDPNERLAGFLYLAGPAAWAYVSSDKENNLGRQRFSAAHELGHAVLHCERMNRYIADVTVSEVDDNSSEPMEREANRFAAELLMPEEVCQARAKELQEEYRVCPRLVLAYRLASELLVSREAMRYRLKSLGVGDED